MFNTPILFLVFNRPDTTARVFEQIRKMKPAHLYIAADGPRNDRHGEKEKTDEVRKIVLSEIDWECEVETLFRDENMGCGKAVSQAIDWFFENVEEGIILEDDTLPDLSFFNYCEELLNKYRQTDSIYIISGTNHLTEFKNKYDYLFTTQAGIWGWATWKRAWEGYDFNIGDWNVQSNKDKIYNFFADDNSREYYIRMFDDAYKGINVISWDYQWLYKRIKEGAIGIVPSKNLVENIGFGESATHTLNTENNLANLKIHKIKTPLSHPPLIKISRLYEKKLHEKGSSISDNIFKRLKKIAYKSYKRVIG